MNAKSEPVRTELAVPLRVLDWIDQVCDRFERAWTSGQRPRVEDYLGEVVEAYRPALLRDLMAAELDARRRLGERPTTAEYAARCPEHSDWILGLFPTPEQVVRPEAGPDRGAGLGADTIFGGDPAVGGDRDGRL